MLNIKNYYTFGTLVSLYETKIKDQFTHEETNPPISCFFNCL